MADPLSIVASVSAVLHLTKIVILHSNNYITGVKDASRDIQQLVEQFQEFEEVLLALQHYVANNRGPKSTALQVLCCQSGSLSKCAAELEKLKRKLEPQGGVRGVINHLRWPLKEKEISRYISQIECYKGIFTFAIEVDQLSLLKSVEAKTVDTNRVVHSLRKRVITQISSAESEKRIKVLKWLYAESFDIKHVEISERRQSTTGEWLLEEPEFTIWAGQRSRLLWGYGIPGAGKTFLSSLVIDYFLRLAAADNIGVAYIYFDYMERDQQRPIDILGSLVKQLACQLPKTPMEIDQLYDKSQAKHKKPTFEDLFAVLLTTSKSFSRVFFVFDALDECDPTGQRKVLLPFFHDLGNNGINVFLTSRRHSEDIQVSFNGVAKIELVAKYIDIRVYIQKEIEEDPRANKLVRTGEFKEKILSTLVDCAKGMFLLARFHIQHLCQQTTSREIETELENLRSSSTVEKPLDPTYDRAIQTLNKQSANSINLALNILSWLVKAKRVLTIDELRHAVSVKSDQTDIDEYDLSDKTILLDVCASLVTLDEKSNTIRLAHYTVREYLIRKKIPANPDFRLATTCITYLSFEAFAQGACRSEAAWNNRLNSYPLLEYAATHLDVHLRACDENLTVDIFLKFVKNAKQITCYLQAQKYYQTPLQFAINQDFFSLHIASSIGHHMVVERLLKEGCSVSVKGIRAETPLHQAASNGHKSITQLLLDNGADLDAKDSCLWSALHQAASRGHGAVVQLLLERGSQPSDPDSNGQTSLHCAAFGGHKDVVRLLLDNGADPSTQDNDKRTPLHQAVSRGCGDITKLLLEGGAKHSDQDRDGQTPLHWAALLGYEAVAQILFDGGAMPLVKNKRGMTALHNAAYNGHQTSVQLLLDEGADFSAKDNYGKTPLHLAAFKGHETIGCILLNSGAGPLVLDNDGMSALHWAASGGCEPIIRLLLEHGADPLAKNNAGKTPLHLAAFGGHEDASRLLLGDEKLVNAQDNNGWTPLHGAAYRGHRNVVRLLLSNAAYNLALNSDGETPLHQAAAEGHEIVVSILLKNGVSPSVQNKFGETAQDLASNTGREAIVRLLEKQTPIFQRKYSQVAVLEASPETSKTKRPRSDDNHKQMDYINPALKKHRPE